MTPKDTTVTTLLSNHEQLQILTYLASFYPSKTGIPASFGEEINLIFSNTLEALKERGLVEYQVIGSSALPAAIAITTAGMAYLGYNQNVSRPKSGHLDNQT